ncbi:hypothetical protein SUDANB174_00890 [Streptomyces sp. enrichment culture]
MAVRHASLRHASPDGTGGSPSRSAACHAPGARGRAALDIRILGPVRAEVAGRPVERTDEETWRLLALLGVYVDHVVSARVMVEELWPEQAPPGALSEVHRRVGDLQRRLTAAGDCLVRAPGGYRLDCRYAAVDVRQFWRDSSAGLRALSADDAATALRRLESALRLWTGDALADMALGPRLRREAEQLSVARIRVEEQCREAELRLRGADTAAAAAVPAPPYPLRDATGRAWIPRERYATGAPCPVGVFEQGRGAQRGPWLSGPRTGPVRAPVAGAVNHP